MWGMKHFSNLLAITSTSMRFKTVEIHDLRLCFEEVTGEDLNWFFDQWFLNLGHPELMVTHTYDSTHQKLNVKVEQVQDTLYMPIYKLPLTIDYWVNGKKQRQFITIENRVESFSFSSITKPEAILFDGEQQLLAIVKHIKTKEEYIRQYELSDKYFSKFRALTYLSFAHKSGEAMAEDVYNTLLKATYDRAWGIRDLALIQLGDYDGENKDKLFLRLKEMAMTEKKATVRAQALYMLSEDFASKCVHEFEENITHLSYEVSAEALNGYLKSDGGAKERYLEEFIDSDKEAYISVISEYYANNAIKENEVWFDKHFNAKKNITYDLLMNYALFVQNIKDENSVSSGIQKIKNLALDKELSFWPKFGAFQALLTFTDNKEAEAAMKEIYEKETDERVKQFYNFF